ncbi:polysialyltransferase family glycosyltransferase [uncultured Fibrobacter sp.]|uniref:polysialyltransferase family glycosyltransferase n=1 Tax=uncultured Fibrobacter sp. TaxID=261512 RepID=UPI00345C5DC5
MKHVFIINSHTTFLTSMGTVEYLHLKSEDVVFLYMRNYKNSITPVPFRFFDITVLFNKIQLEWNKTCHEQNNLIRDEQKKLINELDLFVIQHIKNKYHLYIPHLWAIPFQLFYTNSMCKKVSYIQEGAVCQKKVFWVNRPLLERLRLFIYLRFCKVRFFYGCWFISGCIYKQFHLDSYATNNHYFAYLPSRNHIIKWPLIKINEKFDVKNFFFIFDGFVGNHIAEYDVYMCNCGKIIDEYATSDNYIKFHPEQTLQERNQILTFFEKKNVKFQILNDDIPMEYIILSLDKATFVGFGSSLLHYAKDCGHNVICHDDWMMETSLLFQKHQREFGLALFQEIYK